MPNVGKSTLFNTLSKCTIPAENFPFCTIEPNFARVNVPDDRFLWLVDQYKPKSKVSAFLEVVDIAGLVRGAADGAGLGNAFLSNISAVDGIFHVCRAFEDADITHVEDRVDPVEDLEIIHGELRAKDLAKMKDIVAGLEAQKKRKSTKEIEDELQWATKIVETLEAGTDIRHRDDWTAKEVDYLNTQMLLTAKPCAYLINLSEKDYKRKKNKWLNKLATWIKSKGPKDPIIPYSGAFEADYLNMPEDEQKAYCKENEIESCLEKIIKTGFKTINLIYFFTAGPDEVKCWQIRKGAKAPQAAGAIHTDFERGFICAEVMKYDELKELGSEAEVKAAGKYRQQVRARRGSAAEGVCGGLTAVAQGKTYVVEDGDICYFKVSSRASGTREREGARSADATRARSSMWARARNE